MTCETLAALPPWMRNDSGTNTTRRVPPSASWAAGIVTENARGKRSTMKKHAPSAATATSAKAWSEASPPPRHSSDARPTGQTTPPKVRVAATPPVKISPAPGIAVPAELRPVRFGYFHPDAHEVFLVGSFNGWNPRATPLKRDALGDWSVELVLPSGEYRYRLLVDGEWRDDPSAQQTAMNPFGGFDAIVSV